jgi:SRSO17 transposase
VLIWTRPSNSHTGPRLFGRVGDIEMALRRAGRGYVLGVNARSQFSSWIGKPEVGGTAEEIARELDPAAWQRLSAGDGTKGHGSMTGRISNWPTLRQTNTGPAASACGHAGC